MKNPLDEFAQRISIHSLRVEGDRLTVPALASAGISIHSLRVEGDADADAEARGEGISIHSLRVEGDPRNVLCCIKV